MNLTDKIKSLNYLLILLCLIAGARVWLYSAAFPFVGNVDEGAHIDLVVKYSKGEIPRQTQKYSLDNSISTSVLASCEYVVNKDQYVPLPWWKSQGWWIRGYTDTAGVNAAASSLNHESLQPPLYYAVAGLWLNGVEHFLSDGIGGHRRSFYKLYWMRFLNIPLIMLLVWLAYQCANEFFGTRKHTVFSVAALVALMPQDTFYSVQNDVLSPVCYGFVFLFAVRLMRSPAPSAGIGLGLGIATALAGLVKLSNLPLVVLITVLVGVHTYCFRKGDDFKKKSVSFATFMLAAWTPLLLWFWWNYSHTGTLTASEDKIRVLTWTYKPLSEWLNNSLLSVHGVLDFWSTLMITFWRGELIFYQQSMGMSVADGFFWITTTVFLIVGFIMTLKHKPDLAGVLLNWSFWLPVMFLVLLSLMLDFGQCGNPSRLRPYFTSGRLITAGLIPFCILYVRGFEYTFLWIRRPQIRTVVLIIILCLVTLTEALISIPVFKSQYNMLNL